MIFPATMIAAALLGLRPAEASAAPAGASILPSLPAAVQASTGAAKPRIEDYYTGAKKRDPFATIGGGGGGGGSASSGEKTELDLEQLDANDFVRRLVLKGLMRDKTGAVALFTDPETEVGLLLQGGKLYDYKRNLIQGVQGEINMAQKTVKLRTPDKEVRILRLGEDEESDADSGGQKKD